MAYGIRSVTLCGAVVLSLVPLACIRRGSKEMVGTGEAPLAKELRCSADDSVQVLVPGGEFIIGPPGQQKRVTLRPFYIDRTEVTNAQYAKFLAVVEKQGDAAWRHPDQPASKRSYVPAFWADPNLGESKGNYPVVGVDWFDAYAYAKWADKRLPTEAEWEAAARGTDGRTYPWGSAPPEEHFRYRANFFGSYLEADGFRYTAPVGSFPTGASPFGCLDMAGNAAEWCGDWFGPLPAERRLVSPTGPSSGTHRVVKGGGWNLGADSLVCYGRQALEPTRRLANVGFRCAKDALPGALVPTK